MIGLGSNKMLVGNSGGGGLWVAAGEGTNTLAYSEDGINWTGLGSSIFTTRGLCVAYNGNIWVAGGEGTNTLAYSYDGINWTGLGTPLSGKCNAIAWNGNMWIAGGGTNHDLIYSTDGINWTGLGLGITGTCYGIAWNGSTWTATGSTYTAQSTDGINWTNAGYRVPFADYGRGVASNGNIWVAVGGKDNVIAYKTDSTAWTGLGNYENDYFPIFRYGEGMAVAWNGTIFLAVGDNTDGKSFDGITWNTVDVMDSTKTVAWNGNMWIAGAIGNTNNLAYSTDPEANYWTYVVDSPFSGRVSGIASNPAPNLIPAII